MRSGYIGNRTLQEQLERAGSNVRPILEAVVATQEDVKDSVSEWGNADGSSTDFILVGNSAVRLRGTVNTVLESTFYDDTLTNLKAITSDGERDVLSIEWGGNNPEGIELETVAVRLNPDTGAGQTVDKWWCQMWRLARVYGAKGSDEVLWELEPMATKVSVAAGSTEGEVEFNFAAKDVRMTPGPAPKHDDGLAADEIFDDPVTIVQVWGVTSTGGVATNVGWRADSTGAVKVIGNHTVRHKKPQPVDVPGEAGGGTVYEFLSGGSAVPQFKIKNKTFSEKTISFSGAGNRITLTAPSTGTDLELVTGFSEYGGSVVTPQVASTGSTYHTFADGDLIGVNNSTAGGYDLSALPRTTKYNIRATLTPSTNLQTSPVLYRLGIRELSKTDLDNLANIGDCRWSVDPITLKPEIGEIRFELLRDGILDYRDAATELLSDNHLADVSYRLWVGHPDIARRYWLHIDDFEEDNRESAGAGIVVTAVSPLAQLRPRYVPPTSTSAGTLSPVTYTQKKASTICADLIENQIGLDGRYVGPGNPSTTIFTRTLKERRPGKDYLDQVAFLTGGAFISSQGRNKYVQMIDDSTVSRPAVASFPLEEVREQSITPGFSARITEYTVKHGWDERKDNGRGSFKGSNTANYNYLSNVGRALIDVQSELDDDTCKWVPSSTAILSGSTAAIKVARRMVGAFGAGLILWTFDTIYARPHLEPGDVVSVETDRFVGRSPETNQPIRGKVWGLGPVVCNHNPMGTRFTVWVQSYQDITASASTDDWRNFTDPRIQDVTCSWSTGGIPTLTVSASPDANSVKAAIDPVTFQNKAAVRTKTVQVLSADKDVNVAGSTSYTIGQTAYVSALAFETSTGGGAESVELWRGRFQRTGSTGQLNPPRITDVTASFSSGGIAEALVGAENAGSIKGKWASTGYPTAAAVRAEAAVNLSTNNDAAVNAAVVTTIGDTAYFGSFAYRSTGGTGTESASLAKMKLKRYDDPGVAVIKAIDVTFGSSGHARAEVAGNDHARAFRVAFGTTGHPTRAAAQAATLQAATTNNDATISSTQTYSFGDSAYLSALTYNTSTGGGESEYMFRRREYRYQPGNYAKITGGGWQPVSGTTAPAWKYALGLELGPETESFRIQFHHKFFGSTGALKRDYAFNASSQIRHYIRASTATGASTAIDYFYLGDFIAHAGHPVFGTTVFFYDGFEITPYNATGGSTGGGLAGPTLTYPPLNDPDLPGQDGSVGVRVRSAGSSMTLAGFTLHLSTEFVISSTGPGGQPTLKLA